MCTSFSLIEQVPQQSIKTHNTSHSNEHQNQSHHNHSPLHGINRLQSFKQSTFQQVRILLRQLHALKIKPAIRTLPAISVTSSSHKIGTMALETFWMLSMPSIGRMNMLNCAVFDIFSGVPVYWKKFEVFTSTVFAQKCLLGCL